MLVGQKSDIRVSPFSRDTQRSADFGERAPLRTLRVAAKQNDARIFEKARPVRPHTSSRILVRPVSRKVPSQVKVNDVAKIQLRQGATLIEMLVVTAIVGILVAILLPAVQVVRETAKQAQCVGNLRQIGVAIQNYETTHRRLPVGTGFADFTEQSTWPWNYVTVFWLIRPFLEAEANEGQAAIPVYLCPSRRDASVGAKFDYGVGDLGFGYFGYEFESPWGSLGIALNGGRYFRSDKIPDGASNTLLLGHKGLDPEYYANPITAPADSWEEALNWWSAFDADWTKAQWPNPMSWEAGLSIPHKNIKRYPYCVLKDRSGGYYVDAVFWHFELPSSWMPPVTELRVMFEPRPQCVAYLTSPHRTGMPMLWADGSVRSIGYSQDYETVWDTTLPGAIGGAYRLTQESKFIGMLWNTSDGQVIPDAYLGR